MNQKKVLTMQDISCVGRCSITVALPILSACGHETAILPSAILSTHTGGFDKPYIRDIGEDIPHIYKHWMDEGFCFDAFYTGYLGDKSQVEYCKDIMTSGLIKKDGYFIVDPAMADNGQLYSGFDMDHVHAMTELSKIADIILPNITEATLMVGIEYKEAHDEEYIRSILKAYRDMGMKKVILKGILYADGFQRTAIYDAQKDSVEYHVSERLPKNFHGTGDCFASAFCGALLRDTSLYEAVDIATEFVQAAMKKSYEIDSKYGVRFEQALGLLTKQI